MFLFRPKYKRYAAYRKTAPENCVLCDPAERAATVEDLTYCVVVKARFAYDLWEFRHVTDHLMILPKRHVRSLNELTPEEKEEIFATMCRYEEQNYNIYARSAGSIKKTVPGHQHTHLVKTSDKRPKGGFYLEKPYIAIKL